MSVELLASSTSGDSFSSLGVEGLGVATGRPAECKRPLWSLDVARCDDAARFHSKNGNCSRFPS